ncbi:hypothetical protein ACSVHC_09025 [Arthrobacter sp. KNU-44]|uniref:hypothetical protein n=1 Tax=Arthrobacter sp. KNU-44 TaxID=3450744 RepID=UPI003F4272F8
MPDFLPDTDIDIPNNQKKLNDIWWRIASVTGAGKTILRSWIPRLGPDWKPLPGQHTTPETELGALPQNFAVVLGAVAGLSEQIRQLSVATGAVIDADAIAKKTADEIAKRLSGQGGK